ncbi:MAG: helix-turn-helix domain-containing protein [Anaerolineales bacterium]|nr:helix-turn-helix domain-containing protein [Anaerolineales bacterium]
MKFTANEKYEQALVSALVHIQTHLEAELTLENLAAQAGFSPHHFHRMFTQFVGEPVKEYIRRLRLERAAYRLKIGADTVLEIALETGFKNHESFTRAFMRQFGLTPSAFRENFLRATHTRKRQLQAQAAPPAALAQAGTLLPNGATEMRVRVERLRPVLVAFVRHVGAYENVLEPGGQLAGLWEELFTWGKATGLVGTDSLLLGIPQDDPSVTAPEKQRFDVGVQVPAFRSPNGGVGCQTLSAGLYAVGRHYGTFERLAETYTHLFETQILSGKYALRAAPPFEVYGHTRVTDELQIHYTDVYLPIELNSTTGAMR